MKDTCAVEHWPSASRGSIIHQLWRFCSTEIFKGLLYNAPKKQKQQRASNRIFRVPQRSTEAHTCYLHVTEKSVTVKPTRKWTSCACMTKSSLWAKCWARGQCQDSMIHRWRQMTQIQTRYVRTSRSKNPNTGMPENQHYWLHAISALSVNIIPLYISISYFLLLLFPVQSKSKKDPMMSK